MSPDRRPPGPAARIRRSLRRTLWAGGAIAAVFFAGFGGWSAWAPLSGAAVAPGHISPAGNRRIVQHLEGGIISRLLVRNGSEVTAGQPLVELDSRLSRAKYHALLKDYRANLAKEARLTAERRGAERVEFPAAEWGDTDSGVARDLFEAQRELFVSRRAAQETRRRILRQRIVQLNDRIAGLREQMESQGRQLSLIRKEAADIAGLVEKGYERRPRLLALQRTEAEIAGALAGNRAAVARELSKIGETEIEIASLDSDRREEVEAQLSEVQEKLARLLEELGAAADVLARTVVLAPVSGTVMDLRIHTVGGVVSAGEAVLDIVPSGEELLIDARISPNDIDEVRAGLPARVILTGQSLRNTPQLEGVVQKVSADSMVDERTGETYYLARIELPAARIREIAPHVSLKPGMPTEVMVMTGERTLLDYLIEPIAGSFRKSFNET